MVDCNPDFQCTLYIFKENNHYAFGIQIKSQHTYTQSLRVYQRDRGKKSEENLKKGQTKYERFLFY